MAVPRQCLHIAARYGLIIQRRAISSLSSTKPKTDSLGIPLRPTWSVNDLLSSYPTPSVNHAELEQLHKLSALKIPEKDSDEYHKLKGDLEELVRLVEAVKLVDTEGVELAEAVVSADIPPEEETQEHTPRGRGLLEYAHRVKEEFYVVDTDARQ
ncbi:hypothetical protein PC9H_005301 [Pleurotus ostreatus]|uniref:Uncharacterized protein n=1 Tax=Pleurotus ostreatus TaxID=5322 RepID=A0A8H6ZZA7_PLEOS|nr:uncharacterized protein PC9H_005301 [Pleurotus ostreatus]KAF7433351.1 hypothetical protein PC9H_005301 [Pleurotus ostreatus]KAJ8697968.1 hypothetical protein PTI98_004734 [Pleurotus ostreatus]